MPILRGAFCPPHRSRGAWKTKGDFTFEFGESGLVSGPGVLGKQRDITFEFSESGLVSGLGVLGKPTGGKGVPSNSVNLARLRPRIAWKTEGISPSNSLNLTSSQAQGCLENTWISLSNSLNPASPRAQGCLERTRDPRAWEMVDSWPICGELRKALSGASRVLEEPR